MFFRNKPLFLFFFGSAVFSFFRDTASLPWFSCLLRSQSSPVISRLRSPSPSSLSAPPILLSSLSSPALNPHSEVHSIREREIQGRGKNFLLCATTFPSPSSFPLLGHIFHFCQRKGRRKGGRKEWRKEAGHLRRRGRRRPHSNRALLLPLPGFFLFFFRTKLFFCLGP